MKHSGGKLYGEGMKGFVEDAPCIKNDSKTFCAFLHDQVDAFNRIILYDKLLHTKVISKQEDIVRVIEEIKKAKNIVAKTFKDPSSKENFLNELKATERVARSLDSKYHTLSHGFTFKGMKVFGMEITHKEHHASSYHVFSEGCSVQILDINFTQAMFDKFVSDMKHNLDALHKVGLYHNDMKPDNMIYCSNSKRFKLIDWELSSSLPNNPPDYTKCGTTLYNHPLKFYLGGLPAIIARHSTMYSLYMGKHTWVTKLKSFNHIQTFIKSSFDFIIASETHLSKRQLHKKFYPFYDGFALALSIIFLAEKFKLNMPYDVVDELMGGFVPKPVQKN